MAAPLALAMFLNYLLPLITLAAVGPCGPKQLAAAGLATSLSTTTGKTITIGLCGAVDTFASQAVGAGREDLLGPIFRRCTAFLLLHCLPLGLIWASSQWLLPLITDPEVGRLAGQALLILFADLLANATWRPMNRILAAQRITLPQMLATSLVVPFHYLVTQALVARHGVLGAAAATGLSGLLMTTLLLLACLLIGQREALLGGTRRPGALEDAGISWGALWRLAYPSGAMFMLESFNFAGMVSLSALLPGAARELDVMTLSLTMYIAFFMVFIALGICADTRVGNAMGRGCAGEARRGLITALALTAPGLLFVVLVFGLPEVFALMAGAMRVATLPEAVQEDLRAVCRVICGLVFVDAWQTVLAGAIRGVGRQAQGAKICVLAYWVLGMPAVAVLAFGLDMGVQGMWLGMAVGPTVQLLLYARLLLALDWEAEAERCCGRLQEERAPACLLLGGGQEG